MSSTVRLLSPPQLGVSFGAYFLLEAKRIKTIFLADTCLVFEIERYIYAGFFLIFYAQHQVILIDFRNWPMEMRRIWDWFVCIYAIQLEKLVTT